MFNSKTFTQLNTTIPQTITLVAVSKFHPKEDIMTAYEHGVRIFGESRPQELVDKYETLPKDIQWHMIGQLQTNKIKYIAPFVTLIHSVDSLKLAQAINKEGAKIGRIIPVLLQIHVAQEDTKQGFTPAELIENIANNDFSELKNIEIKGVMTMATFTDNQQQIRSEFQTAKQTFDTIKNNYLPQIDTLSMGMTGDYKIAIDCGATMVRIGSALFGDRF